MLDSIYHMILKLFLNHFFFFFFAGSSLTGVTALWSLSKTHLS